MIHLLDLDTLQLCVHYPVIAALTILPASTSPLYCRLELTPADSHCCAFPPIRPTVVSTSLPDPVLLQYCPSRPAMAGITSHTSGFSTDRLDVLLFFATLLQPVSTPSTLRLTFACALLRSVVGKAQTRCSREQKE